MSEVPSGSAAAPLLSRKRKRELTKEERDRMKCTSCALMFSRFGLSQLNSTSGFQHHTHSELKACVSKGLCSLCRFIGSRIAEMGDFIAEDEHLVFRNANSRSGEPPQEIDVLFVEPNGMPDDIQIYPFAVQG